MIRRAAILVVNGGIDPKQGRWIDLCFDKLQQFTDAGTYQVYLWNNNFNDTALKNRFLSLPWVTYIEAAPYERLAHPHAIPLQRLYTLARDQGAGIIVTLDSDAHPLRRGWLTHLLSALDDGAAIAGVWRDEMSPAIRPYIHPSCLCTTVAFVEQHRLRFDFDPTYRIEQNDILSHFTWLAEAENAPLYRLSRSNRRNFHHLMGGIYGDYIYHHGAASRERILFHDDVNKGVEQCDLNRQIRDQAATLLFNNYEPYIGWLRGENVDRRIEERLSDLQQSVSRGAVQSGWLQNVQSGYYRDQARKRLTKIPFLPRMVNLLHRAHPPAIRVRGDGSQSMNTPMLSPFTQENLAPLPHGWTAKPPDFVGIGAPKSGTDWWYMLLCDHPQIVDNRVKRALFAKRKEIQYFLHFQYHAMTRDEIDLYRQAFATPPGALCGEFSTQYLSYPVCIEHLAAAVPEAKIIVTLRNPIDQFISHLNHLAVNRGNRLFHNLNEPQRYLFDKFSLYSEAILHSLYNIGLERLFRYFDREKVLVLQYERSVRFPQEELARTYRFLGADERYVSDRIAERVNVHNYIVSKPSPTERSRLADYFEDDVRRVLALCPELDAALWPDFAPQSADKNKSLTVNDA